MARWMIREAEVKNRAPRAGREAKLALRATVGAGLVGLLLWRADPRAVVHSIAQARPVPVTLAFGLALLTLVVSALRWRSFLNPLGFRLPSGALIRLYFVGAFFNAFLPTGIGGDAYKATRLRGGVGARPRSFASVLLDRIAGVVGLALLALAGAFVLLAERRHGAVINTTVGLALAGLLGCGLLVAIGPRRRERAGPSDATGLRGWLRLLLTSMSSAGLEDRAAVLGLGYGIVTAGMIVGTHALLADALGVSVPLPALAGIAFLSVVVVVLPVSINGLGVREATNVWALTAFGVGHGQALAFAFLILGVLLASSAVGGVVYLLAGGEVGSSEGVAAEGPAWSGESELGQYGIHEPNDGHGLGWINGGPAPRQDGVDEPPDEDLVSPEQALGGVPSSRGPESKGVTE